MDDSIIFATVLCIVVLALGILEVRRGLRFLKAPKVEKNLITLSNTAFGHSHINGRILIVRGIIMILATIVLLVWALIKPLQ
jgi:hypothetical protein